MQKILATAAVTLFLMTASSGFAQSGSQGGGESGTSSGTSGQSTSQGTEGKAGRSGSMANEERDEMKAPDRQNPRQSRAETTRDGRNTGNTNATRTQDDRQPSGNLQGSGKSGTQGIESTGK